MKVEDMLRRLCSSQVSQSGLTILASVWLGIGATITAQAGVINLNPNETINLSQLLEPNAASLQVGDKLFADFSFASSDTTGILSNYLPASALNVTALSNPSGFGIRFSGSFDAAGNISKDVVLSYSVTVTDITRLISDVHLSYNGTAQGSGSSSVTEQIFTDSFGEGLIGTMQVNPALQELAILVQPREKLFIEKNIAFGGGNPGDPNRHFLSIIDQNFSEVPEPSTLVLAGTSCFALLALRRRKRL